VVQFFGRGLTLPFTIIYLHEVRGFSLSTAGALMGLIAVVGLLAVGPAGVLVDRFGARVVIVAGIFCAMAGLTLLAFATTPWVAAVALCLLGLQLGVSWPAVNVHGHEEVPAGGQVAVPTGGQKSPLVAM